ncbi:Toll/interleukin-1 receptor domain-containing protein [Tanacetum coccineum]
MVKGRGIGPKWQMDEGKLDTVIVYASKNGQEMTGKAAYIHYKKESGGGFKNKKAKKTLDLCLVILQWILSLFNGFIVINGYEKSFLSSFSKSKRIVVGLQWFQDSSIGGSWFLNIFSGKGNISLRRLETYKDDEKIKQAKLIRDELIKAIVDSKFYIIVFSKNYASSSWCLEELVKIMECQTMDEHTAYPVFYDVEPTEVRKQSGPVGDAFAKRFFPLNTNS